MIGAGERQTLLEKFCNSGMLSHSRILRSEEMSWGKSRRLEVAVEGQFVVDGRPVTLRLALCGRFPLVLPHIYVCSLDMTEQIPHVEHDGRICYRSSEGLLMRYDAPYQVIEEAIEAAIQTLTAGLSGANWSDFLDELEAYWAQLASGPRLPCYVEPDDTLRQIELGYRERKFLFAADSFAQVCDFSSNHMLKSPSLWRGIYIPLMTSLLTERFNPKQFESLEWVKSFVWRHLSGENQRRFERLGAKERSRYVVILGVPRRKGGKNLVALEYRDMAGSHPLSHGCTSAQAHFVALERRDRAVVMARCRGGSTVSNKRVVIVGCGAVGGHLAFNLARAGIGHLTLIDPDKLTAQNTFRHVLGLRAIGENKVDALKREMIRTIPYIDIDVVRENIEGVLQRKAIDVRKCDLLIYAAGDPTLALYVNDQMHRLSDSPAVLFTWVEPYGIGGHALLANTKRFGARGCFGCLFNSPIKGDVWRNRADFAAPEQHFAKVVSGCATMYTPYADLDAVRTAELSARLALEFLGNDTVGHPLLSWKGDSRAFHAAGYRTSKRYDLQEQTLWEQRFSYAHPDCGVCGSVA